MRLLIAILILIVGCGITDIKINLDVSRAFVKVELVIMEKRPITFNYWQLPSIGCVGPPGWVGDASQSIEPTKVEIPILGPDDINLDSLPR